MDFIANEGCWKQQKKPLDQGNGTRTNYVCNHCKTRGAKCAQKLFTLHGMSSNNTAYHLYRTEAAHSHDKLNNQPTAIPENVREIIRKLVQNNVTLKYIMPQLRQEEDIEVPAKEQVQNFIKYRFESLSRRHGCLLWSKLGRSR